MGRPSKLTDKQWESIGKRLLNGERAAVLAREFGVSKASVSARFSERTETVKSVANQIVETERSLSLLNVSEQIAARSLADELKSISTHLAGAAKFGAMTAHRLSGIAQAKSLEIDDAAPLDDKSRAALADVAVLGRMANGAAEIGLNLLRANKDTIEDLNKRESEQSSLSNPARGTVFKIVRSA
jgi:hypothetical protein